VAEYEALVNGLHIAIELGIRCLDVWGDSQLVVGQVMMNLECRNTRMVGYYREVRWFKDKFGGHELNHVLRWDS
jgi:ribonuclease HI